MDVDGVALSEGEGGGKALLVARVKRVFTIAEARESQELLEVLEWNCSLAEGRWDPFKYKSFIEIDLDSVCRIDCKYPEVVPKQKKQCCGWVFDSSVVLEWVEEHLRGELP